jgi:hypothetical protein
MHRLTVILFCVFFQFGLWHHTFTGAFIPIKDETGIKEGEALFKKMAQKSLVSSEGNCWRDAIDELERGCEHLTHDVLSRLAMLLSNCYLAQTGSDTCPCNQDQEISQCLKEIKSEKFLSHYATFFIQTHKMCHYLQSDVWQKAMDDTFQR